MRKLTKFVKEELQHKLAICEDEIDGLDGDWYVTPKAALEMVLATGTVAALQSSPAAIAELENTVEILNHNIAAGYETEGNQLKSAVARLKRAMYA